MSDAIPVNRIKGVGEKTAALFGRINVFTVEDLIGHYPRDYETYDAPVPIREASAGSVQAIYGQITAIPNVKKIRNLSILNAVLTDDNGDSIQLTFFNMPFLKKTIALAQVSLYLSENNTKCAHRVFSEYLIDVEDNIKSPAYAAAVSIYRRIGDEDSAFIYSKRLMSIGTLNAKETALEFLIDYYSAHGDYNRVRRCIEKYKQISDSIRTVNVSEAIMKIHSLYDYSLKEKENEKLKSIVQRRGFVSTLLVLSLFLIIAFILYHRERTKKKYEKVKYMHEHLEQLYKTAYVQYDVSLKQKENEIIRLKKELDKLNNGSVEEKEKMRIYEILRNKIKNNTKISEKSWNDILESINLIYPAFKQKLVGTFGLDNDEYKICILVKLGLLNIEIATIMCKSPGAITQKRSSMSKKIFNGNGNSKDFNVFIKSIE